MLGTDCNYISGNINYCFIWNEFSDKFRTFWNELYNKIKYWLVWIIWQKVLLGINFLITLLSTVWNKFCDKIKYYHSKSSYKIRSLKILADFHICIFVAFNCSLNCSHACNIHYVVSLVFSGICIHSICLL